MRTLKNITFVLAGIAIGTIATGLAVAATPNAGQEVKVAMDAEHFVMSTSKYEDISVQVYAPVNLFKRPEWASNSGFVSIGNNTDGLVKIENIYCQPKHPGFCPTWDIETPYYINAGQSVTIPLEWNVPNGYSYNRAKYKIGAEAWIENPAGEWNYLYLPLMMKGTWESQP